MFNINTDFTEAKNKTKELFNFLNNLDFEITENSLRTLYALHDTLKGVKSNLEPVESAPVVSTPVDSAVAPSGVANNAVQTAPEVAVSPTMPISPFVA